MYGQKRFYKLVHLYLVQINHVLFAVLFAANMVHSDETLNILCFEPAAFYSHSPLLVILTPLCFMDRDWFREWEHFQVVVHEVYDESGRTVELVVDSPGGSNANVVAEGSYVINSV